MYRYGIIALGLAMLFGHGQVSAQGTSASDGYDAVRDPDTASRAVIDRFSQAAGKLMVRTGSNGLPKAGQPIDFDHGPFITRGLGPRGNEVLYYNFDIQSATPAPIYVLFREGEDRPVPGQLNIVDVIPGDPGYNDFWQVVKVTVPKDYVANTLTSLGELRAGGYAMQETDTLVNCPIVPEGSTAGRRLDGESTGLQRGWYRDQVVYYFTFEESSLKTTRSGAVPISPIFVTFNVNPDQAGGGPPSGFRTENGSSQTHNVLATLPGDAGYSPLWQVSVYDNAAFERVRNLRSLGEAKILASGVALVNCPVVLVEP